MQNYIYTLLLALFVFSGTAEAQRTEKDAKDDLNYYRTERPVGPATFKDRLWFGTGAQLGFSSSSLFSIFNIGLSPIIGYNVNNFLSVGPVGAIAYNRYRESAGINRPEFTQSFVTWRVGAFARAKVFRGIFIHGEYSLISEAVSFVNDDVVKTTRATPFLGGGYNQGGGPGQLGFEVVLLFRLTQPEVINDSPFEFRSGINYNF